MSAGTTTNLVDIMFMSDTTGSMGGAINSVKTGVSGIIATTSGLSPGTQYAVSAYRDRYDSYVYNLGQDLTSNTAAVQAAVNGWSAGGGGDGPEAQMYALQQAALTTSWRPSSTRMLFWLGDYPGHDPAGPPGTDVTEAQATAALLAGFIRTFPISVGSPGLDAGPFSGSSEGGPVTAGQATRIATATSGQVITGGYDQASDLIEAAISEALTEYHSVALGIIGLAPGLNVTLSAGYAGNWLRNEDRDFGFSVGFEGVTPGVYDFDIVALVDGTIAAYEHDSITVSGVPEPASLLLIGSGLLALGVAARRRRR